MGALTRRLDRGPGLQAARIMAACALAYGGAALLGLKDGFWALITAVVVMQPALGDTVSAGKNRVTGTLIGAAFGLAVIEAGRHGMPPGIMFWCALAPLALLSAARPNLRLSCVTLIVVVLVPSSDGAFSRPLGRIGEILLGTVASILVSAMTFRGPPAPAQPVV